MVDVLADIVTGRRIIVTESVGMESTGERLFPESKNRSKRIKKKLMQRHGGEYCMRGRILMFGGAIVMHPSRFREFLQYVNRDVTDGS